MKKTAVIVFAIALLGIVGIVEKSHASGQLVAPSLTSAATSSNMNSSSTPNVSNSSSKSYKDGTYTGDSEFTPYGTVQIAVTVSDGKVADVNFLQMPNDQRESQQWTQYSEPLLKRTTLNKQSASIDFVSGATQTSQGYQQSLQSALDQAQS